MRSAKSFNSLNQINQKQRQDLHQMQNESNYQQNDNNIKQHNNEQQIASNHNIKNITNGNNHSGTSPICRCRVMYLGSSVPHITKDGLQGIQEPLNVLYPDKASLNSGNAGIDSWLSVWSNGILIENVDESGKEVKKFFKIDALHYCAAVKFVPLALQSSNPYTTLPNPISLGQLPQFLPLDSPQARQPNPNPPIFASILRRTTGIKVLECHAFICKREAAANALVRCCFHAYADTTYAKQIGADLNGVSGSDINNNSSHHNNNNNSLESPTTSSDLRSPPSISNGKNGDMRRAKSISNFDEAQQHQQDFHKVRSNLNNAEDHPDNASNLHRPKSINGSFMNHLDNSSDNHGGSLWNQQRFSKSLHHLNNLNDRMIQQVNQQSYYNPYASRVPSYPPQNLLDSHHPNNGGTLRSIKSMAANSIASTLLRSKKHAKAMSMAQLNQEKLMQQQQPPVVLQPLPPMFLPNIASRAILNGSQTMKPISNNGRHVGVGYPGNFETMTPKEMKKLLKKNAKYGLEPARFPENGLPQLLPFQPIPSIRPMLPIVNSHSKSGTMMTSASMFSDIYGTQAPSIRGPPNMMQPQPVPIPSRDGTMTYHHDPRTSLPPGSPNQAQIKQILVKPTTEFLKSKAGKKWLKQQKQFKKLLPPHLDGLPIVFGPPPVEALEAANIPGLNGGPPTNIPVSQLINQHHSHPGPPLPMMDSSGYYNTNGYIQHPHGQNGRASAASTLLRYSPQYTQPVHDNHLHHHHNGDYISEIDSTSGYQHQQYHQMIHHQQQAMIQQPMMYGNARSQPPSMHHGMNGHEDETSLAPSDLVHQRHFPSQRFMPQQQQPKPRNHMVEQRTISLEDENDDYDDEECGGETQNHYSTPHQGRQNSEELGLFF